MNFLQPFVLLGLALVIVPILIHLLNLYRHKSLPWASMMFLGKAKKKSRRLSKIRRWLTLFLRMLAVGALVFMVARPMTGGDSFFSLSQGKPETLLMVLDRSASMEAGSAGDKGSKREIGIKTFCEWIQIWPESRFVFFESVFMHPMIIDDPSILQDPSMETFFGPTDTASNMPACLYEALNWLDRGKFGKTEILLVSDFQESSWKFSQNSNLINNINKLLEDVKRPWTIRVLSLPSVPEKNKSLSLLRLQGSSGIIQPTFSIMNEGNEEEKLAVEIKGAGVSALIKTESDAKITKWSPVIPLDDENSTGWVSFHLPEDSSPFDNSFYALYGKPSVPGIGILSSHSRIRNILKAAAESSIDAEAKTLSNLALTTDSLSRFKVLFAEDNFEDESSKRILQFVEEGGFLALFPSFAHSNDSSQSRLEGWNLTEESKSFEITQWDKVQGILANFSQSHSLPLDFLNVRKRAVPASGECLAYYSDGKPFLTRKVVGKGFVYLFSTLPHQDWSSLEEGYVLVPVVQRIIQKASSEIGGNSFFCGDVKLEEQGWENIDSKERKTPQLHAGIYERNGVMVAVNRPEQEDDLRFVSSDSLREVFRAASFTWSSGETLSNLASQKEVWSFFAFLVLGALLTESFLGLPNKEIKDLDRE